MSLFYQKDKSNGIVAMSIEWDPISMSSHKQECNTPARHFEKTLNVETIEHIASSNGSDINRICLAGLALHLSCGLLNLKRLRSRRSDGAYDQTQQEADYACR